MTSVQRMVQKIPFMWLFLLNHFRIARTEPSFDWSEGRSLPGLFSSVVKDIHCQEC